MTTTLTPDDAALVLAAGRRIRNRGELMLLARGIVQAQDELYGIQPGPGDGELAVAYYATWLEGQQVEREAWAL